MNRRRLARGDRPLGGFTLIEIMAVMLIIAFAGTLIFPNLRRGSGSQRHDQALSLAGHIELARQRAVMTGKIHRVLIDVDAGSYHIEWYLNQNEEGPQESEAGRRRALFSGELDIDLLAPPQESYAYEPIPGKFGQPTFLENPFYFDGVDTPEGWLAEGEVAIVFDQMGGSDLAQIVITDPDGFAATLDVLPLQDSVRIRHETAVD